MKPFRFRDFTIQQNKQVFRVGTDGVLLGALARTENLKNILEIGTGTGLVSLMLAQRCPNAQITALDINPEAVSLAVQNFADSPFSERLKAIQSDFKAFGTEEKYSLIISNPPYFEPNTSQKDVLARQQLELPFEALIAKSAAHLSKSGHLIVIIPFQPKNQLEELCLKNGLYLQHQIIIFGIENGEAKRAILEFGFDETVPEESRFVIEKTPRVYSDQYLEATSAFHVFS